MLVSNDGHNDTRVRKEALAVAATGAEVVLLALAPDGRRAQSWLGPVRIIRVPVQFTLRDAQRERARARRAHGLPLLRPLPRERDEELRHRLLARRRDEPGSGAGPLHEVRQQSLRARRLAGRLGAKASRVLWGGSDRILAEVTLGAHWRSIHPAVDDYELAYGPVVDALQPDLIHAHDVEMLPVAARAAARASAAGREVPWIYDAHEWVAGLSRYAGRTPRRIAAWADLEREYIRSATAVVTVSDELAQRLQARYTLPSTPTVVLNIPPVPVPESVNQAGRAPGRVSGGGVRARAGVGADTPLLVYSGAVQRARGVDTVIDALSELPLVHLAVVCVPAASTPSVAELRVHAQERGVADRVHFLDPVPPADVVAELASADVGMLPLRHFGSHEVALANKLFEYLHAGLPMVVSDCAAQERFVRRYGLGEVHPAEDAAALSAAVRSVLADLPARRAAVAASPARESFTWPRQVLALHDLYRRLGLPGGPDDGAAVPLDPTWGVEPEERAHTLSAQRLAEPMLGIGPANSAGQAWAWTQAVRRAHPQVSTEVLAILNGVYDYPADITVSKADFARDGQWGLGQRERAIEHWTHALIEAGRPLFGALSGPDSRADIETLTGGGVRVGLVFHGSEVRDPRRHARSHEFSPFRDASDPYVRRLQEVADRTLALVEKFDGPTFVSTPDQLEYVSGARWLPVVLDLDDWPLRRPFEEGRVPLVVHAPSNPVLKGTATIEEQLEPLVAAGRIRYERVSGLQPQDAAALVARADIVIDQVLLGLYGVLACEGLAGGAVVLGLVGDAIRERVEGEIPILETTPLTVADRVEEVLSDLPAHREAAATRRAFVERWHDGRVSAQVLGDFLGLEASVTS